MGISEGGSPGVCIFNCTWAGFLQTSLENQCIPSNLLVVKSCFSDSPRSSLMWSQEGQWEGIEHNHRLQTLYRKGDAFTHKPAMQYLMVSYHQEITFCVITVLPTWRLTSHSKLGSEESYEGQALENSPWPLDPGLGISPCIRPLQLMGPRRRLMPGLNSFLYTRFEHREAMTRGETWVK